MKFYIALFCLTTCITINAAQMAKLLTPEQENAAQEMFQLIYDKHDDELKKLLQKYPEIVNEMPAVNLTYESADGHGTHGWGTNSRSALHCAIEANNHEALCILLEYNANPDIQNCFGATPLMWKWLLSLKTNLVCIQTLIEAGANKEIKSKNNNTAEDIMKMRANYTSVFNYYILSSNYYQAIAHGEAERDRYAQEKPQALQEIASTLDLMNMKDLATIIHGYAYGVLPRDLPKSDEKKGWLQSHCTIQ